MLWGVLIFLVAKKIRMKSNRKEPPVEGRDRENGGRCFELSWNEMFCLLGCLILCQSVFFKN